LRQPILQKIYNNFPFPQNTTPAQQQKIETAAQAVLDARTAEEIGRDYRNLGHRD